MKLQGMGADQLPLEPRPMGAGKASVDARAGDPSPPFEGVLADLKGGGSGPSANDVVPSASIAVTGAASPKPAAPPGGTKVDRDVRIGSLGKDAISPLAARRDAALEDKNSDDKASAKDTGDPDERATFASLLRRVKVSDETAAVPATPQPAVVSPPAVDLVAMLGAPPVAIVSDTPTAGESAASAMTPVRAEPHPGAPKRTSDDVLPPAPDFASARLDEATGEIARPSVTRISVETHLVTPDMAAAHDAATPNVAETSAGNPTTENRSAPIAPNGPVTPDAKSDGGASPDSNERDRPRRDTAGEARLAAPDATSAPSPSPQPTAPIRVIAHAVAGLAAQAAAPPATRDPTITPLPAPARTLSLQVSAPTIGTVDVRLHMRDGGLDLSLTTSDAQTHGAITRERETLESALRDQHYELHSLTIQDGSGSPAPGANHATRDHTSKGHTRSGQGSGAGGSGSQGEQSRPRGERRSPERAASRAVADSRAGSLFV